MPTPHTTSNPAPTPRAYVTDENLGDYYKALANLLSERDQLRAQLAQERAKVAELREAVIAAMKLWEDDPRKPFGGVYDTLRSALNGSNKGTQ